MVSAEVRGSNEVKICLSCSFSIDELTGCVGVIHSAQLDNLTLTVLSVERSGGVNCTVDELMEGNYSVAVFGWFPGNVLEQEPVCVTLVLVKSLPPGRWIDFNHADVLFTAAFIPETFPLSSIAGITSGGNACFIAKCYTVQNIVISL